MHVLCVFCILGFIRLSKQNMPDSIKSDCFLYCLELDFICSSWVSSPLDYLSYPFHTWAHRLISPPLSGSTNNPCLCPSYPLPIQEVFFVLMFSSISLSQHSGHLPSTLSAPMQLIDLKHWSPLCLRKCCLMCEILLAICILLHLPASSLLHLPFCFISKCIFTFIPNIPLWWLRRVTIGFSADLWKTNEVLVASFSLFTSTHLCG